MNTLLSISETRIKEITAPKGYILDAAVCNVNIKAGALTTVNLTDTPQYNRTKVLLQKIDAETNINIPQGKAVLEDAQFTVKYFNGYYTADPEENGIKPSKTWIMKTDEQGFSYLNDTYKISGDEFFYSSDGTAVLPLGTVTIQETKAPEGYLINSEVFVRQITVNGAGGSAAVYSEPVVSENILSLDIVKREADNLQAIPGTVFKHTLPDGISEEIVTDENGMVTIKGLTRGVHKIEEIKSLEGYLLNPGIITFEVAEDNTITLLSNTSKDETGKIEFSVQENGTGLVEIENVQLPYNLQIYKKNELNKRLEGAEFTIYKDEACTEIVAAGATDSEGRVLFSGLKNNVSYYLKETKAPQGYRLPHNEDGSEIIYKVLTKSNPVQGIFGYYINDEEYVCEGDIDAAAGTVNDRTVNLIVVNNTGIEMPETGNYTELLVMVLGAGCMICGIMCQILRKGEEK